MSEPVGTCPCITSIPAPASQAPLSPSVDELESSSTRSITSGPLAIAVAGANTGITAAGAAAGGVAAAAARAASSPAPAAAGAAGGAAAAAAAAASASLRFA